MSYYNQPDHELIDRRDGGVRSVLLRLASARVQGAATIPPRAFASDSSGDAGDWVTEATAWGVPPADAEPLVVAETTIPFVWRGHYVVAMHDSDSPDLIARLDDLGFEVIRFEARSSWPGAFARLLKVLGRAG
jgi:hypothetical protein